MKVSQALKIWHIIDGKKIPSDMADEHLVYYSTSREKWINVMDMDVCHLVRAFRKTYNNENHIDSEFESKETLLSLAIKELDQNSIDKIFTIINEVRNESSR